MFPCTQCIWSLKLEWGKEAWIWEGGFKGKRLVIWGYGEVFGMGLGGGIWEIKGWDLGKVLGIWGVGKKGIQKEMMKIILIFNPLKLLFMTYINYGLYVCVRRGGGSANF